LPRYKGESRNLESKGESRNLELKGESRNLESKGESRNLELLIKTRDPILVRKICSSSPLFPILLYNPIPHPTLVPKQPYPNQIHFSQYNAVFLSYSDSSLRCSQHRRLCRAHANREFFSISTRGGFRNKSEREGHGATRYIFTVIV